MEQSDYLTVVTQPGAIVELTTDGVGVMRETVDQNGIVQFQRDIIALLSTIRISKDGYLPYETYVSKEPWFIHTIMLKDPACTERKKC